MELRKFAENIRLKTDMDELLYNTRIDGERIYKIMALSKRLVMKKHKK